MAYNTHLAERISRELKERQTYFTEKKMFGGLCFMVDEKMCIGVIKDQLMVRINPELESELSNKKGAAPMLFTGRPMKGYLYINDDGWDLDEDLSFWVKKCLEFNPMAKSSKKKK